ARIVPIELGDRSIAMNAGDSFSGLVDTFTDWAHVGADPDGHVSRSIYDEAGRLLQSVDAMGKTTVFTYDADGHEPTATDPDVDSSRKVYDAAGNVIQSIDALGKITQYTYDADGRVTLTTDPDGHTSGSVFDAAGRLVESIDG